MKLRIAIEGKTYEVEVEVDEDSGLDPSASGTAHVQSSVLPPAVKVNTSSGLDESKVSRSPVAGLVVRVHVEEGQEVQARELLMVLEAMKMETNITAPSAGKIASIKVTQGDSVQSGQIVVEFE